MVSNGSEYGTGSPLIGVTSYVERARYGVWDNEAALIPRGYVDSIIKAGGVPVMLPSIGFAAPELLARVDGIAFAGGADIEPARYGARPHPKTAGTRSERDAFELDLIERALAAGLPVLGVCRGMQLLNVALGGTVDQHLPERGADTGHQPAPATFGDTRVTVAAGTLAARILGTEVSCPCYHHQGVDKLGEDLRAVGWAADGTVEAVELPCAEFVLGVQWHPEVSDDYRLFAALVDAASGYRRKVRTE